VTDHRPCDICGAADGTVHIVREMMFGTRKSYSYFRCADCGCMQLRDALGSVEQYPPGYYSFSTPTAPERDAWLASNFA